MSTQPISTTISFVPELLQKKGMTKAAVIDDAFDDFVVEDVVEEEIPGFLQNHRENTIFLDGLVSLNIDPPDEDMGVDEYFSDDIILKIWHGRKINDAFESLLFPLFSKKLEKMSDVDQICENLRALDIDVECFGSDISSEKLEAFKDGSFSFIFIDYFLGSIEDADAVKRAEFNVKQIHARCPDKRKPVTVLMSSLLSADLQKENFRTNAGLLEGVFRFTAKVELINKHIISLRMGALAKEFENRDGLQDYINAILKSAKLALANFDQDVNSLKVEDYLFIQSLGLQNDQTPLGDYIAWLYGSYWGHLLFADRELQTQQKRVDSFFNMEVPLIYDQPSDKLAIIYMSALFDEFMDDIGLHPARINQAKAESSEVHDISVEFPYLHIGDVFTNDSNDEVWMVINAQCDLERVVPNERSIFLIKGDLIALNEIPEQSGAVIRTEFFRHKDQSFRIVWRLKEVMTRRYDGIPQWKMDNGYKRRYRLKLPFALEVQRSVSAILTRIGLPVSPPSSEQIKVEVLHGDEKGQAQVIVPLSDKFASRITTRTDSGSIEVKYMLTLEFVCALKKAVVVLLENYKSQKTKLSEDQTQAMKIEKKIVKLSSVLEEFDGTFLEIKPLSIVDKKTIGLGKISVGRNLPSETYTSQSILLINILDGRADAPSNQVESAA